MLALEPKESRVGLGTLLQEKAKIRKKQSYDSDSLERVNVWDERTCIFYEENSTRQTIQVQPQQKEDGRSDKRKSNLVPQILH